MDIHKRCSIKGVSILHDICRKTDLWTWEKMRNAFIKWVIARYDILARNGKKKSIFQAVLFRRVFVRITSALCEFAKKTNRFFSVALLIETFNNECNCFYWYANGIWSNFCLTFHHILSSIYTLLFTTDYFHAIFFTMWFITSYAAVY